MGKQTPNSTKSIILTLQFYQENPDWEENRFYAEVPKIATLDFKHQESQQHIPYRELNTGP